MKYAITYTHPKKKDRRLAMKNGRIVMLKSKINAKKIAKEYAGLNPRVAKVKWA